MKSLQLNRTLDNIGLACSIFCWFCFFFHHTQLKNVHFKTNNYPEQSAIFKNTLFSKVINAGCIMIHLVYYLSS